MELILFAPEGWLRSLELVCYSAEPPGELPDPAIWRIAGRSSKGA
jgi:hypothetical protein